MWKQGDTWHDKVSDVRSQLRFLGEVESLKKKRKDEEERERLMRLAKVSYGYNEPNDITDKSFAEYILKKVT